MARIEIPILGTTVDTSKPADSATNIGFATVAVALMFGIVAGGKFLYNRGRAAAGVGQDQNPVPGV